jgi:hypothetical protein
MFKITATTMACAAIFVAGCIAGSGTRAAPTVRLGSTGGPPAAQLLSAVATCKPLSHGKYKSDDNDNSPADIPICGREGAVFWQADLDVDCDGKTTTVCNLKRDPDYQAQTAATDSAGGFLDASTLPYIVVPLPSDRFDYAAAGLALGGAVAVIYNGLVAYGVIGDVGPNNIIGEASYAMATMLGIDPDPATGGTNSGVTYVAFTGPGAIVKPIEDHAEAERVGQRLAAALIAH